MSFSAAHGTICGFDGMNSNRRFNPMPYCPLSPLPLPSNAGESAVFDHPMETFPTSRRLFVFRCHVPHELHGQFFHFLQVLRLLRSKHQTHRIIRHLHHEFSVAMSVFGDASALEGIGQVEFFCRSREFVPCCDVRHPFCDNLLGREATRGPMSRLFRVLVDIS